jgi:Mn2+/Fe2+ NRAMP family transporter
MRDAPEGGAEPVPLKRLSRRRAGKKERMSRLDVFTGMAFSNVVMFAIIVATAQTLHIHHLTHIQSAAEAAKALRPFAGRFASAIFALGFIGSGLLAVPVLAASGSVGLFGVLSDPQTLTLVVDPGYFPLIQCVSDIEFKSLGYCRVVQSFYEKRCG